jgi:lactoylglutathione lyase
MRSIVFFLAGTLVGAALIQAGVAQDRPRNALNHVGVVVEDYAAAIKFYTETLGFKEAYTVDRPDGSPVLTYLQLNRETFVELIPAQPNQTAGITHFGIEVADIDATVARLRERGLEVADPGTTPANARFVRIRDADGIEIEVMEFGPEALQRQAMDAWQ